MFNVPMSLLFCYDRIASGWGRLPSCAEFFFVMVAFIRVNTVFIMHLFFRHLNYGCGLWGTNYLAPILQLVKLQNEVVRNANNVMTS